MCGILVSYGGQRPFSHRLLQSLRRRGPDQIGFWTDGSLHVGSTRLSIIGLDERSTGPFENQTHVLAYNGEIYNFHEINRRLQAEGVDVRGANDAVALLHAWTRWGTTILPELTGLWAFAVYDKARRRLTLVRDQFGIKPLYYCHSKQGTAVSSLMRTLLEIMDEPPELDYQALSEYARYQFTFGDKTFVKQIKKVMPGHVVEIDLETGAVQDQCYEDIFAPRPGAQSKPASDQITELRELLVRCILDSTISDTSFTTFCSGGVDSSLITRITRPDVAYHCNYSDPECNETFYAQQVVAGTPTRLFVVNAQESFNLVERLKDIVEDFDELTIGSVILPLDDLLSQVKRRYKVILTGTGGDELFGGYVRYQLALGACYQDSYRALYTRMRPLSSAVDRFELAHRKGDTTMYKFYEPAVEETFKETFEACSENGSEMEAMLRFDRRNFLSGLLNIDDKMCGRHSLESRPSFLHQKLVRRLQQFDSTAFARNADLKPLLRDLADGILPKSVIHRSDKMGFTTPVGTFVNNSSHLIREQIMNSRFLDHYDLKKINLTADTKFSREVFGLLMLDLWLNRYASMPVCR